LIECNTGKIIYVSENIENILHFKNVSILKICQIFKGFFLFTKNELIDRNIFQFINPNDLKDFQNQLTVDNDENSFSIIDARTGLIKTSCSKLETKTFNQA
jgi:hypothetical protein